MQALSRCSIYSHSFSTGAILHPMESIYTWGNSLYICVYIIILQYSICHDEKPIFIYMYACFQFCMGIIMTHLIQKINFFFISNPDPNKLQRSSWLNLLVNIYLLHRLLWHGLLICYHQIKYELLIWC